MGQIPHERIVCDPSRHDGQADLQGHADHRRPYSRSLVRSCRSRTYIAGAFLSHEGAGARGYAICPDNIGSEDIAFGSPEAA